MRGRRAPEGFSPGGPRPAAAGGGVVLEEGEALSYLAGDWQVVQLRRGNRWSLDELVTADLASDDATKSRTLLDLGTGIGSVLLLLTWKAPSLLGIGVEAQDLSAALARKSIRFNGCGDRVNVVQGDLRDARLFAPDRRFDLVTGTPPYFPQGTGPESSMPQCAPARFELRGGVEEYAEAAARWLSADGAFVFCGAAVEEARMVAALKSAALAPTHVRRVHPKRDRTCRIVVIRATRKASGRALESALVVRDERDQWTDEFREIRRRFGMPDRPPQAT